MESFAPEQLEKKALYNLLVGVIGPRPIAWVSTMDDNGRVNVAPFSYFAMLASNPPTIGVSVGSRNGQPKDTTRNAQARGEMVVHVVTEDNVAQANLTSIEAPPEFSEPEFAGLSLVPSMKVAPPSIKESPVRLECRLSQTVSIGSGNTLLIAEIVWLHVDAGIADLSNGHVVSERLRLVGRMGGPFYSRTRDRLALTRPTYPPSLEDNTGPRRF